MKLNDEELQSVIAGMLESLGLDTNSEGLRETPARFLKYLREFNQPLKVQEILGNGFEIPTEERSIHSMVAQAAIPFRMICEHHLLPALGEASVGYIPNDRVVGLSKLTRLVQAIGTEKPTLQELANDRIADILNEHLKPKGVAVVISAEHTCMACRGINSPGVSTITSALKGVFRDVPQAREEFFNLIRLHRPR